MNQQDETRQALLRKSNLVVFALAYLAAAIPVSQVIFEPGNLAAPDTLSKVLLLSVVLLIFAPFVAFWAILFRLRVEHAIKEKDFWGGLFLTPAPKGTWGNPDISSLFGEKEKKIIRWSFRGFVTISLIIIVAVMLSGN